LQPIEISKEEKLTNGDIIRRELGKTFDGGIMLSLF
jgi:hypothetical protein